MPIPQPKIKVKDLKTGYYPIVNLKIRSSNVHLIIKNAIVRKNNQQQHLYSYTTSNSFGEGTEVIYFDLM